MTRSGTRKAWVVFAVAVALALAARALGSLQPSTPAALPDTRVTSSAPATSSATGSQPFDATQLDPRVTQATVGSTIGVSGYSTRVRPPESVTSRIKRQLMREHGYTDSPADYELDHFIPLGVGGSSSLSNLWLEPIAQAKLKDKDELFAHDMVTSGRWTLDRGQQYIRDRWRIVYTQ